MTGVTLLHMPYRQWRRLENPAFQCGEPQAHKAESPRREDQNPVRHATPHRVYFIKSQSFRRYYPYCRAKCAFGMFLAIGSVTRDCCTAKMKIGMARRKIAHRPTASSRADSVDWVQPGWCRRNNRSRFLYPRRLFLFYWFFCWGFIDTHPLQSATDCGSTLPQLLLHRYDVTTFCDQLVEKHVLSYCPRH